MIASAWRDQACEQIARRSFDLLVIGGGIIGAGIANEAARAGLAVALVDRGDFGGATSSASSKLIHGGLRYLRLGDVGLVREAHRERRALMRVVAPHLVRPLPFLVPLYRGGPYRRATTRLGLSAYSALAGERVRGLVPPERARERVPDLRLDGLGGCGLYFDAWTHDARLCLANVRAAADAGATVLNYAEVTALRTVGGRVRGAEIMVGGEVISVDARAVVNATGPWLDRVRRLEDPAAVSSGRLSKGVHVLVPLERPWSAALTIPQDAVRVSFAYPWEGMLLLGTTDELFDGEPDSVAVTDGDIRQVLEDAAIAVDPELVRPDRVRGAFVGLRVLPDSGRETARTRRETVFLDGAAGMLSVAGGKLTTYRLIALQALERLAPVLGLRPLARRPVPLPGAADPAEVAARLPATLSLDVRAHLAHLYGSLAGEVVAQGESEPGLLAPLHPDAPDIAAQVVYAARREWATSAEDVLRRRTTLGLRGLAAPDVVAQVERILG